MKNEEIDKYGISTLEAISQAHAFNEWMYDTIAPFCSGKIIELGSGIGNISTFFIRDKKDIVLSDLRDNYRQYLMDKFHLPEPNVRSVDMVHDNFEKEYADLLGQFDTVFALNVVEHIEDHHLAMRNAAKLLKKNGNLIILVPAYQWLYNAFDRELGHYRRFTKKTLSLFIPNNVELVKMRYFNFAGIPGWFVSGSILKKKEISPNAMRLFNRALPIVKLTDLILFKKVGLSVWFVARKK
ncbi:MAG: class I SAM-dependent methyltransferase [Flavobacteriales bacterium]